MHVFTHQLLDPGPYFLGWLYHTLSCPMTSLRIHNELEKLHKKGKTWPGKKEAELSMRTNVTKNDPYQNYFFTKHKIQTSSSINLACFNF